MYRTKDRFENQHSGSTYKEAVCQVKVRPGIRSEAEKNPVPYTMAVMIGDVILVPETKAVIEIAEDAGGNQGQGDGQE